MNGQAGSYVEDPKTGAVTLVHRTEETVAPAPVEKPKQNPAPAPAPASDSKE